MAMPAGVLGKTIKAHRIAAKMTLAELAEKLGISPNHMQRLESEKNLPSVPLLYELAHTLNFSVDEAFFCAREEEAATRKALQRRITECGERDLRVLLATANALLNG